MAHREQDVCADIIWSTEEGSEFMAPEIEFRVEKSQPPESYTRVSAIAIFPVEGALRHVYAEITLPVVVSKAEIEAAKATLAATFPAHAPQEAEEGLRCQDDAWDGEGLGQGEPGDCARFYMSVKRANLGKSIH